MEEGIRLLIVDDEESWRGVFARQMARFGFAVEEAPDAVTALAKMKAGDFDVAFIDFRMPEMDGLALIQAIEEAGLEVVPVMLSGAGTIDAAVEAMRSGAFDFAEKPSNIEYLRHVAERAARHRRLKRHARLMQDMSRQWEATFDVVPDLVAVVDVDGRFVRVNLAAAARLGCLPEEIVGKTFREYAGENKASPVIDFCVKAFRERADRFGEVHDAVLGGDFRVSCSLLRDAQGLIMAAVLVARDITEQRKAEAELRKAHREAERLLSSMSAFLIAVDSDLLIVRWNKASEVTFDIAASDVVGSPFFDTAIPWDWSAFQPARNQWLDAHETIRLPEIRYVRPDGAEGFLSVTANAVRDDAGAPVGFFLMGNDITERRHLEIQLIQAQKLESIGQLAAGIAHEINTPTQYVGDNLQFLREVYEQRQRLFVAYRELVDRATLEGFAGDLLDKIGHLSEEYDSDYLMSEIPRAIEQSLDGVDRVAKIVRAMKEFSHPGQAEKTAVDLNHAIESTITVARNEWKYLAEMEMDFDPDLPHVRCLPGEINQVVLNILINAAHAIGEVVGDGSKGKGTISARTRRENGWVRIEIADTGCGIPEQARSRIFDPFFTTKGVGRGTGQGLAIAHNVICDKHGGTIGFTTETGKGTTFVVRLPVGQE